MESIEVSILTIYMGNNVMSMRDFSLLECLPPLTAKLAPPPPSHKIIERLICLLCECRSQSEAYFHSITPDQRFLSEELAFLPQISFLLMLLGSKHFFFLHYLSKVKKSYLNWVNREPFTSISWPKKMQLWRCVASPSQEKALPFLRYCVY